MAPLLILDTMGWPGAIPFSTQFSSGVKLSNFAEPQATATVMHAGN